MHVVIIRYLLAALVGSLVTWAICDKIAEGQVATAQLAHQKELRDMENRGRQEADQARAELRKVQKDIAADDAEQTKKLEEQRNEIERLNDCLRTGSCGLRINATCKVPVPVPSAQSAGSTAASGVDDDARPVLTPVAESAYFALRHGINEQERKLVMCQEYVRSLPGNNGG